MPDYIELPNGQLIEVTSTQQVRVVNPQSSSSDDERPTLANPIYFLAFIFIIVLAIAVGGD